MPSSLGYSGFLVTSTIDKSMRVTVGGIRVMVVLVVLFVLVFLRVWLSGIINLYSLLCVKLALSFISGVVVRRFGAGIGGTYKLLIRGIV